MPERPGIALTAALRAGALMCGKGQPLSPGELDQGQCAEKPWPSLGHLNTCGCVARH